MSKDLEIIGAVVTIVTRNTAWHKQTIKTLKAIFDSVENCDIDWFMDRVKDADFFKPEGLAVIKKSLLSKEISW